MSFILAKKYNNLPPVDSPLCMHLDEYNYILFRHFRKILKKKATKNFVVRPSVRLYTWINSAPTGRIFMKFDI